MKSEKRGLSRKKFFKTEYPITLLLAGLFGSEVVAHADTPLGLVGGQMTDNRAYAAFLADPFGDVSAVSGLSILGVIRSVGMNSSGAGLIGGQTGGDAYAAYIASGGTLVPLTLSASAGYITSVAINEAGLGLIGGRNNGLNVGYIAHVLPDGTVTSLPVSADVIEGVALNDSGVGLVGGEGSSVAYAAYVDADGTVTQVLNTPAGASHIYAVAINNSGEGLIGGIGSDLNNSYAAFVTPGGSSPLVLSPIPSGSGVIYAVAINSSGSGLIGGVDGSSNAYGGYALPDGAVITLFDAPFSGIINSAALNDSGIGLIGGRRGLDLYAALVQNNGTLIPLFSSPVAGTINSAALNEAGLGLIVGQTESAAGYIALVAPNGAISELNLLDVSRINSVAIQSKDVLNQAMPQSAGSFGSAIYMQLAATSALENRIIQQNKVWSKNRKGGYANENTALNEVVCNEVQFSQSDMHLALNPKTASMPMGAVPVYNSNSIWVQPFGDFVHFKGHGSIPSVTNKVGGVLVGYDRQASSYVVGAALGYAYNYAHYSKSLGHAKVQEELASLYGSYYTNHFWFTTALWRGLYQLKNIRHTLAQISSKGKTHGWILQPHLELASPWEIDRRGYYYVEPFIQADWVNNWQHRYTESGSAGLNLQLPNIYNSLLQSEIGLRFYERFVFGWGDFCLEEKLSYVNQAPFGAHNANTSFVSSATTFPVAIGSTRVQNLGSVQLLGCFIPRNSSYPYGGFALQATAGSSYQSYFVSLFVGVDF